MGDDTMNPINPESGTKQVKVLQCLVAELRAEVVRVCSERDMARAAMDGALYANGVANRVINARDSEIDRLKAEIAYEQERNQNNVGMADLRMKEIEAECNTAIRAVSKWATIAGLRKAMLDRCLKMLRVLQWRTDGDMPPEFCPYCDCRKEYGHDLNCPIAALICTLEDATKGDSDVK